MEISLRSGHTTAVVRQKGAQMTSFKGSDGREVIWQADPAVWANHAPVLFPICGKAKDDHVIIDGVAYPMGKHGFSRNPDFAIERVGDDFVELVLTPTEESKPSYPFDFAFHVRYTLTENGFSTQFVVENHSETTMPFCCGGHPGFIVPMEEGASYTDYQLVFPQVEEGKNSLCPGGTLINGSESLPCFHHSQTLPLSHDLFDERDALIFTELKSRQVDLVHRVSGHGLRFAYPKMEVLAIWSMPKKNADYVCLEPWHGMPGQVEESGRFEDKPFVTLLAPHHSWQGGYSVSLI